MPDENEPMKVGLLARLQTNLRNGMSRRPFGTFVAGGFASLLALVVPTWVAVSVSSRESDEHRDRTMRILHQTIEIGDSYEHVLNAIWQNPNRTLTFNVTFKDWWIIAAANPLSSQTEMWIRFEDEKVSRIEIVGDNGNDPMPTPKGEKREP